MKHHSHDRDQRLSGLSTRELVIVLLELGGAQEEEPRLRREVSDACAVLRRELLRRERLVTV